MSGDSPAAGRASRAANLDLLRAHLHASDNSRYAYEPSIERLNGAIALPGTGTHRANGEPARRLYGNLLARLGGRAFYDGGIYDAEGRIFPPAIHVGGGRRHLPGADPPAEPRAHLQGPWLWGGVLHPHFGHFLTESLGRLWAIPRIRAELAGIIWLLPGDVPAQKVEAYAAIPQTSYMTATFEALGLAVRHHVITEPTRIDRLVVPAQLMMNANGELICGHEVFRRFARAMGPGELAPDAATRPPIYVSRAGLSSGRFVLEEELEAILAAAGWTIMRPETMRLAQQIAAYTSTTRLVFAEGSALHLFAMVARPEQKVAILSRRVPLKDKFALQLRAYGVRDVRMIDAVDAIIAPTTPFGSGREMQVHQQETDAVLDWDRVGEALVGNGFLAAEAWRMPPADKRMFATAELCLARSVSAPSTPYAVIERADLLQDRNVFTIRTLRPARPAGSPDAPLVLPPAAQAGTEDADATATAMPAEAQAPVPGSAVEDRLSARLRRFIGLG